MTTVPSRPSRLIIRTANCIQPRRVKFVWEGRIPTGTMTLMPGEEGIGKTTVGIRLMADLTVGALPGEYFSRPRGALIVAPEDGTESVMVPRVQQAGADLSRVGFVDGYRHGTTERDVVLPLDLDELALSVLEHDVGLVWVDSLINVLPENMNASSYQDVNRALKPINDWAHELDVAVVAPWHWNKGTGADTAQRMMGSRGFRTANRSVLIVAPDDDLQAGESGGIVAVDKSNSGSLAVPAVRYRIEPSPYTVQEHDAQTGEVQEVEASVGVARWVGEVEGDGRAIARAALAPSAREPSNPAEAWLTEFLGQVGTATRTEALKAGAAQAGLSESQVDKAAQKLGVVRQQGTITVGGHTQRSVTWSLP